MKIATLRRFILLISCTSKDIAPTEIVGKWAPTYMIQRKNSDGSWGAWGAIYTLIALPVVEFTSDGRFLSDGKSGANCCYAGNKYNYSGSKLVFTEFLNCPNVDCLSCGSYWDDVKIIGDTLIYTACSGRGKLVKTK